MINIYGANYKRFLIIPGILFVLFLFAILVYPGVPKGIDLQGGNMIIVRASSPISATKLESLLKQKFDLAELQITEIQSPNGYGVTIQYSKHETLSKAEEELKKAKSLIKTSPTDAATHASNAENEISKILKISPATKLVDKIQALEDALIKAKELTQNQIQSLIEKEFNLGTDVKFQKREVGPVLGETFWNSAINVSLLALVLVVVVIFLFFREIVPSFAVIAAAIFDISGALALMAIFNVPLSLSSIPALLMLIGYSVDTDIMLTTRLLKSRDKELYARAHESMITGMTMTFTTIAALLSMLVLSYLGQIVVIYEIAAVLFFGLLADLPSTWLMNAPVLLWYIENKEKKVFA